MIYSMMEEELRKGTIIGVFLSSKFSERTNLRKWLPLVLEKYPDRKVAILDSAKFNATLQL